MTKNSKATSTGITLTLLAVALTGCAGPAQTTSATTAPAPTPAASAAPARAGLSGKVVETMDAGGYTYVNLESEGTKRWVAAPVMKVEVGQELKLLPGAEMTNFSSKALNRTFDSIIFSGGPDESQAAAKSGKPAAAPAPVVYDDPNESTTPILSGKVIETMDAMNYTYIKLEKDGKNAWAAVPYTPVKVGDELELQPGTEMGKFTSKKLNKTFNAIYFAAGIKKNNSAPEAAAGTKANAPAAPLPAGHPSIEAGAQNAPMAPVPVPAEKLLTGTVVETAEAGGYTYICLEKDGKRSWAAVPSTKVTEGKEISLTPGVTMTNFVSKSLNRTFDKILFSNGIQMQ